MIDAERRMDRWQSVFVAAGEGPLTVRAAGTGVQVVCLQLPHKAAEYQD